MFCKKKLFLQILQNSQDNTCVRVSFLNKVADLRPTGKCFYHKWLITLPPSIVKLFTVTLHTLVKKKLIQKQEVTENLTKRIQTYLQKILKCG